MKSEWKMCLLGDALTFQRGKDLPKNEMSGQGYPVVGSNGIIGYHNKYNVEAPCLTVGRSGNVGLPYLIHGRAWAHNTTLYVKEFKLIDPIFAYYLIKAMQLGFYAGGSAVPTLNRNHIHLLEICIPSLPTQRKIASILSSLDDKIENNNAICKNLEEQMSLCYESLSRERNCKEQLIGNVAEKVAMGPFGSNIKVSTFVSSGVPVISGAHLHGKIMQGENFNYITAEHASKLKNSLVHADDIVLTHAGTLGQASIVPPNTGYNEYMISQRQFFLRCNKKKIYPLYALLFLHSQNGQRQLLSYANQTGVPSIAQPTTNLKKLSISVPPIDVQRQWYEQVKPLYVMNLIIMQENRRLTSLRNALLPKLISGKIDVDKAAVPLS